MEWEHTCNIMMYKYCPQYRYEHHLTYHMGLTQAHTNHKYIYRTIMLHTTFALTIVVHFFLSSLSLLTVDYTDLVFVAKLLLIKTNQLIMYLLNK